VPALALRTRPLCQLVVCQLGRWAARPLGLGAMACLPRRQHERLRRCAALGVGVRCAAAGVEDEEEDDGSGLPILPWAEIMQHRFLDDIWVVVDGKVYDMTEFIAQEVHPGGEEIPLQYAGKDATEFWMETHGHLLDEIMEDLDNDDGAGGEGENTFLEILPKRIGRVSGRTPIEAKVYSTWREQNWGGNVRWGARGAEMAEPESLEELCEIVKSASSLRVVGRGHSFVPVCEVTDEAGTMLSLGKMCAVLELDEENLTVTCQGGITYSQLVGYLSSDDRPYALANVQSHPSFTVAGTLSTASHGSSGIDPETGRAWLGGQPSLAHSCLMVLADGTTRRFTKDDAEWGAVIVNIGCIGVMAEITLDLVPDHDYELTMYRNIPCAHLIKHWREMAESCGGPGQVSQIQVLGNWWGPQASMSVACRRLVPPHSPQITNDDCEPTFFGEVRAHHLHLHYQRALLLSPFLLSLPLR